MLNLQIRAFSVCDDPDYFYEFVQGLLDGLHAGVDSRDIVEIQNVSRTFSLSMKAVGLLTFGSTIYVVMLR